MYVNNVPEWRGTVKLKCIGDKDGQGVWALADNSIGCQKSITVKEAKGGKSFAFIYLLNAKLIVDDKKRVEALKGCVYSEVMQQTENKYLAVKPDVSRTLDNGALFGKEAVVCGSGRAINSVAKQCTLNALEDEIMYENETNVHLKCKCSMNREPDSEPVCKWEESNDNGQKCAVEGTVHIQMITKSTTAFLVHFSTIFCMTFVTLCTDAGQSNLKRFCSV